MKILIRKPLGYSQIGRKDQQEDAVWPLFTDVSTDNPCIVLCDGVGGSEHGEVASQISSKVIGEYITSVARANAIVTEEDMTQAVNLAYDELEKIDTEASEDGPISMATTLTCICLHEDGILAAHMGDSRIYQIRPGVGLLYQSSDHSLVNALLQAGELTLEEAKNFPRKNVITKAIQPHCQKRYKAEVHQLTNINKGDYLFLCCDGVLEQLTNERLVEILSMSCPDDEKIKLLEAESTDRTKDNYTAYLIPIDDVVGESSIIQDDEVSVDAVENEDFHKTAVYKKTLVAEPSAKGLSQPKTIPAEFPQEERQQPMTKNRKYWQIIVIILLSLALIGLLINHFNVKISFGDDSTEKVEKKDTVPTMSSEKAEKKDTVPTMSSEPTYSVPFNLLL